MTFSQLPPAYAPTGQPLLCTLSAITAPVVEVQIHLSSHGVIGIKRFVNQSSVTFDLSPYLARRAAFRIPLETSRVEVCSDRQLMVTLVAVTESEQIETAPFILRPARDAESPTSLLTTLPTERLLARDEMDELTFLTRNPQPLQIVVTHRDGSVTSQTQVVPGSGLFRFRLVAADYPDAEQILVDGSPTAVVRYTLTSPLECGVRIAWHSSRGSLEQYTFPVVKRMEQQVTKKYAYGADGYRTTHCESEERMVLLSALESEEMMHALKELLTAEQVWMLRGGAYEAVDVISESSKINGEGHFSTLTLTLRSKFKNKPLCNS